MPHRANCAFCGRPVPPATGFMYVKNDGTVLWFCSRKCYKNMIVLKRKARKLKWTLAGRAQ